VKTLLKIILAIVALVVVLVVGGYFALQRADIPYATLEAKYANADSKFIDLASGVRVHYRDRGNPQGRALLLVHGFSESLETWEQWVPLLSSDFRVVSLDLPGHGLTRAPVSYSPTIPAFADTVAGIDQTALSIGAQIGMPGLAAGADRGSQCLTVCIRAGEAAEIAALAGAGAGDEERRVGRLRYLLGVCDRTERNERGGGQDGQLQLGLHGISSV